MIARFIFFLHFSNWLKGLKQKYQPHISSRDNEAVFDLRIKKSDFFFVFFFILILLCNKTIFEMPFMKKADQRRRRKKKESKQFIYV